MLVGVIQAGPDEGGHAAVNNNELLVAVGLHTCRGVGGGECGEGGKWGVGWCVCGGGGGTAAQ
jgi:hypothetical protein